MNTLLKTALVTLFSAAWAPTAEARRHSSDVLPLDFIPVNISGDGSVVIGDSFSSSSSRIWFTGENCSDSLKWTIKNGVDGCIGIDSVRATGISRFTSDSGWISGEIDLSDDCFDGLAFVYGNAICQDTELRVLKNYDRHTEWSSANDVSDDGSMAVGEDYFETWCDSGSRALWWTDTTDARRFTGISEATPPWPSPWVP